MSHHQAGHLREAEGIYRQILAQRPDHADALHLLGVLAGEAVRKFGGDSMAELVRNRDGYLAGLRA